mmetsp:Transcript_5021/g.8982  ORF Transcript_5021/g.8982 Transcript_5021/m.8982 type:complete len:81 (-) Transcript_5021:406-648(-)
MQMHGLRIPCVASPRFSYLSNLFKFGGSVSLTGSVCSRRECALRGNFQAVQGIEKFEELMADMIHFQADAYDVGFRGRAP